MNVSQWTLAALAAGAALPAHAQPADSPQQGGLGEIVVTAERREERLQTTPIAVTALTPESLERFQIDSTQDVAKTVPNLKFMPLTGSRSTLQVSLRGGSEQTGGLVTSESSVAFYVDDVYRGRLAGSNAELGDVERIEVLRGPQGTLYGRNAFSGAVKIVTRTPTDDSWMDVAAGFGRFEEKRISASVGGPLIDGVLGGSFAALYHDNDGYVYNEALGEDVYRERNVAARGKLHWYGNENLKATLTLSVTRDDNHASANYIPITTTVPIPPAGPLNPGAYVTTEVVRPIAGDYVSLSPFPPDGGTDQDVVSLDLSGPIGGLQWRSITSWVDTQDRFSFDLSGGRKLPNGTYYIAGLARESDAETTQYSQELHLSSGPESGRLNWLVGLYWFREDSTQVLNDLLGLAPDFLLPVLPQTIDTETTSYAAFMQGTYEITDRLSLTAGLRYTKDRKELDGLIQNRLPFGPGPAITLVPVQLSPEFESWTPKVGLDFEVNERLFTYLSFSKGFKAGGFNGLAVANPAVFSTVYEPQNVWAYEAGLKATLADGRLLANVSVFRNDLKDLQQTIQIGAGSFSVQNVGDATVDGVEVELTTASFSGFSFFLNAGFMDDEYTDLAPTSEAAINGAKRLPILSRWNYRAGFNYDGPPVLGSWRFRAGADWTQIGPYFSVVNNRLQTEGRGMLDANVGLATDDGRWSVMLSGKNLNDEYYFTTASTSDAIAVGEPRTWYFSVRYRM
jgi:iron complex outermembrane receptor protein